MRRTCCFLVLAFVSAPSIWDIGHLGLVLWRDKVLSVLDRGGILQLTRVVSFHEFRFGDFEW